MSVSDLPVLTERELGENQCRILLESAPDAMVVVNGQGEIVLANARTTAVFGYAPDELLGQSVEVLVPNRLRARHREHREDYSAEPHVRPMGAIKELIGRHKNGTEFPVEISLSPISVDTGILVVSAIRDITDRKQTERRLREEKRFSDAVIDSLPALFCMLDEQGRYVRWNKNTEQVLGYSGAELAGRARAGVISPEDLPRVEQAAAQAFRSGVGSCEYENVTKGGRRIPFLWHGVSVEINDARYLLCVEMDVSERRRIERALRESEERYRVVAETATDAIITVGAGDQIIYANPATVELFGYALDELLGRPLTALMPESVCADHLQALEQAADGGDRNRPCKGLEMTGRHRSGREFPIEASFGFLRQRDNKALYAGIVRDISDRVRAEMELERRRQELAHVMRVTTMGEMAAGLAHEVNQPLAAIAAYARGASVRIKAGKANLEDLAGVVDRIAEDAHRAGEVIRRLRQFVKKRETHRSAVDANRLAVEVCRFVGAEAAHRQVAIELKLASKLPKVEADPIEIQQVLLNLVRNAFDAVAPMDTEKRRVIVRTRRSVRGDVELGVDDAGPGISTNLKEQVFEPFFTSKEEGLGMGLAISRTVVESHRGRIWARRSRLGGASVRFSLPLAAEQATDGD